MHYLLSTFILSIKKGLKAFLGSGLNFAETINQVLDFTGTARMEGLLVLESKLDNVKNPFFKKGLQLAVNGTEPEIIKKTLEMDMDKEKEMDKSIAKFYETAGTYAPTIGIIGVVLGLFHFMEYFAVPEKFGGGITVAFIATVYSVGTTNLFWPSIGAKIKLMIRRETTLKELIVLGCVAIAEGENPHHLKSKLEGFLEVSKREYLS